MSSDRLVPPSVKPDPAYIAASAASQIVNSDREDRGDDTFDIGDTDDTAVVSPGSLILINAFLDHLLFSFLASARSTSIASLRPAILEVLKPRLGKEAIDGADEELEGYLAGGDAEELLAFHSGQEFKGDYNLNLIWRRTRLRCMVYTRLGDMEEEDEEIYLEQEEEEEDTNDGRPRLTRDLGSVSPAAAIFLTSIIEFIGEQALFVASEAAYNRSQTRQFRPEESRHLVEEVDVEKIAFNTTLGRLWRAWKKKVRTSILLSPRPMSRELHRRANSMSAMSASMTSSRNGSISEANESSYFVNTARRPSVGEVLKEDQDLAEGPPNDAGQLPNEPDFDETETTEPDEINDAHKNEQSKINGDRPRSMVVYSTPRPESPMRTPTQTSILGSTQSPGAAGRPMQRRQRSSSLPARHSAHVSPFDETFTTPTEGPDPLLRDGDQSNAKAAMPMLTNDANNVPDHASSEHAVSTMYDGAIDKSEEKLPKDIAERTNRGISSYTETSNYTDEEEQGISTDASNPRETADTVSTGPSESRESTVSSNFGFQGTEMDPTMHQKETQIPAEEQPGRSAPFDQSDNETEGARQHVGTFADLATIQKHQLRTYDDSGQAVKRDIPVLYEAPSNEDVIYNPDASVRSSTGLQDEEETPTPKLEDETNRDSQQGVPPLTPLRELMEAAGDTSDEASSTSHSRDTPKPDVFMPTHRSQGSGGVRSASYSSSTFNNQQSGASATKLVDLRTQPLGINTGTERAAVQRVTPTSSPGVNSAHGRKTSNSSNRDGRPITAQSNTSQLSSKIKGIIGRESGDLHRQPLPGRTSSGDSGSFINGSHRTPSSANKDLDFDELIRSDETVKYTLTPQNMREMEVSYPRNKKLVDSLTHLQSPDSPRWQAQTRSETADLADFIRSSGPSSPETERPSATRPTKLKGLNGLRSNPANGTNSTATSHGPTSSIDTVKAQAKAATKTPGPKSPGATAREPTTKDDSLRDFADFIRSTGPDVSPKSMPRSAGLGVSKPLPTGNVQTPQATGTGKPLPPKLSKPVSNSSKPVAPLPKGESEVPRRTTSKLQAREPTISNSNATAELAEFFRSGPGGGQLDSNQQSTRTPSGAQLATRSNGLGNGRMREAVNSGSSVASTQDSFAPSKMTQSSANSRTGLLSNRGTRNDETLGPVRTQQRNKDPYAIDSEDEDMDGYGTPQPPEREEESLSDFLRNYNPPPTATNTRTVPIALTGAPKPTKQTGPTIRERIARNIAVIPDYRPLPPKAPKKTSASKSPPQSSGSHGSGQRKNSATSFQPQTQSNSARGRSTNPAPQLPPINPRETSPHLVSQNGTKIDTYKPTQPTYAKHVERKPKQHLQAREEQGSVGGMGDLADFLRETEPPPPSGPIGGMRPMSPTKEKEESAFGRMFSRRKKEVR